MFYQEKLVKFGVNEFFVAVFYAAIVIFIICTEKRFSNRKKAFLVVPIILVFLYSFFIR